MKNQFEMSKNTKRKALNLSKEITEDLESDCYFVSEIHILELSQMVKRHLKKELK